MLHKLFIDNIILQPIFSLPCSCFWLFRNLPTWFSSIRTILHWPNRTKGQAFCSSGLLQRRLDIRSSKAARKPGTTYDKYFWLLNCIHIANRKKAKKNCLKNFQQMWSMACQSWFQNVYKKHWNKKNIHLSAHFSKSNLESVPSRVWGSKSRFLDWSQWAVQVRALGTIQIILK